MKKLFYLAMAMLLSMAATAQSQKTIPEKKGYFAFSGGLAIPVSTFSSTNLNDGGFAKTGFNLNLHGGYNFTSRVGLGGNIFFATYGVNSGAVGVPGISMDHWQYYGVAAGPTVNMVRTDHIDWALTLYAGVSRANSPVISYENSNTEELWSTAFAMQLGTNVRYMTSPHTFVIGALDYTAMKPKWNLASTGEVGQDIHGLHLSVGLGWRF